MMKFFIVFISFFLSLKISAQIPNFNCDDFRLDITSNVRSAIDFLSEENYVSIIKDSIHKKKRPPLKENKELYEEFQKKFPKKITRHCISAKYNENDSIKYLSICDNATILTIISKEYNFYIFHQKGYEIDNYLLFNTENQTIYTLNNYPIILENGKLVYDIGSSYQNRNLINFYKFEDGKTQYLKFNLPILYVIKDFKIIKKNKSLKIATDIFKYQFKKIESDRNIDAVIDLDNSCRKFLLIN